ncbi:MAG: SDR family NAD(P)-dependent oxidoreductase [Pseudomonadales bacterium]
MSMSDPLKGKRTLVTGAASGIGRAVVKRFVAAGGTVIVADYRRLMAVNVDTAIVSEELKAEALRSPDVIAAEVVDLLLHGHNGQVRTKLAANAPSKIINPPDLD